jgi:hypothetical protein
MLAMAWWAEGGKFQNLQYQFLIWLFKQIIIYQVYRNPQGRFCLHRLHIAHRHVSQ